MFPQFISSGLWVFVMAAGATVSWGAASIPDGFKPLFNGKDLDGWVVRQSDNHDWRASDGVIDCDPQVGPGDRNLWTTRQYGDFELLVDWRIKESPFINREAKVILPDGSYKKDANGHEVLIEVPNTDSGIFLRGQHKSQVNIWCWPIGSGEVWGYRTDRALSPEVRAAVTPKVNADRPVGEWNTFHIVMKGDRLAVTLNGRKVIENAQLPGVPTEGPIALQHHGDRKDGEWGASFVQFRNIYIKEPPNTARVVIPFPDSRLSVHGLPWFAEDQPALRRLPARLKDRFREPVWQLAQHPSGGRIRFRTDSTTVGLVAENPGFSNMHHMASVGENGVDLYVDRGYMGSAWPDRSGKIAKEWKVGRDRAMRDVTVYLPLYKAITVQELSLDPGARLEMPTPYAVPAPIVYYGSSITQGGCASNPGGSCQAILERRLNADFVNLGFSGNGLGEPALAAAICELNPSCIVLDFWGNPSADQFATALPAFVEILRKRWARLPVLITSPFYFPAEETSEDVAQTQSSKRRSARHFVDERRRAGDNRIWFVDGLKMLSKDQVEGLVDGVHCNSLGFYFNAQGLEPFIRDALAPSGVTR